ncbi:MAG TPA: STAS domain-containing protein [Verrucomicrobiae bacterium]|nr:STAS domain-containing protein [Verrucomicrobiae bacterium]
MPELEILVAASPRGARLVTLLGPVVMGGLFELQDAVRRGDGDLIVDLSQVPYMDSAGLGALLGAFASCQRTSHKFALVAVSDRVMTLLKVSGVDKILPRFNTVDAADSGAASATA